MVGNWSAVAFGLGMNGIEDSVKAAGNYYDSRFRFGQTLATYKAFFLQDGAWIEAARVIGKAIHRNEKTIFRIIEGYERASKLPAAALQQLEAEGIDPAAKKYEGVVAGILAMPSSVVETDPKTAVSKAVKAVKEEKKAGTAKAPKADIMTTTPQVPASDAAAIFRPERETLRSSIRKAIASALTNVQNERKIDELKNALEEAMFGWGMKDVRMIVLTPRPPAQPANPQTKVSTSVLQSQAA